MHFPLGDLDKKQTRELARKFDLKTAEKPESQDICFVPNGDYASIVEKLKPGSIEPGKIIHLDGRILGQHKGTINYTVGQRRGLGIGGGEILYVIKVDAAKKEVIVGPKKELSCYEINLKEINWIGDDYIDGSKIEVMVKIRSSQEPMPATLIINDKNAIVTLKKSEDGVAPGQACVFYKGNRVLGGGWIEETDVMRRINGSIN